MVKHICWLLTLTAASLGQAQDQWRQLSLATITTSPSETASGYGHPLLCDANGNLYLHAERLGVWAVRKLNPKGELLTLYTSDSNPSLQLDAAAQFWARPDGEVYQIVYPRGVPQRDVFVYKADGTYESKIELQVKWMFFPAAIAVYPSGNMLITGESHDPKSPERVPFTGLFSGSGKLLKVLWPEGDEYIETRSVNWSQMAAAKDGNIYVMRWNYPATVYAIADGGAVVRKFNIDPGSAGYRPSHMQITGDRLAVLFFKPHEKDKLVKIVDLEGRELATYDASNNLGAAFACYTLNPERFLFLTANDDHKIELRWAAVR